MMIDSHCHLAAKEFEKDLDQVIGQAQKAGVTTMVCIGDTVEESERGLQIGEKYDQVFCTVGVHPHHAKDWSLVTKTAPRFSTPAFAEASAGRRDDIRKLALSSKKVVGIGEIGLDYHYDFSPRDIQRKVFKEQLLLASELSLPAVVHCREAVEDLWTIVDEIQPDKLVMHCCTEKWEDVKQFVERGYLLSFTGIATYPKSEEIRRTIKECPLNQLMIETDAPFLAPVPYRGKRNEPAFVVEVARSVAAIKGLSLEEVDRATSKNAVEFFSLSVLP